MDYVIPLSFTNCYIFVTNTSVSLQKFTSTSENTGIKRKSASKCNFSKKNKKLTEGNQSKNNAKKDL